MNDFCFCFAILGNPSCPKSCTEAAQEDICGSDGKTYASMCLLQQKSCQTGSVVKFHHYGKCGMSIYFSW